MSEFFEAIWHGEGIGDGGDLDDVIVIGIEPGHFEIDPD